MSIQPHIDYTVTTTPTSTRHCLDHKRKSIFLISTEYIVQTVYITTAPASIRHWLDRKRIMHFLISTGYISRTYYEMMSPPRSIQPHIDDKKHNFVTYCNNV